MRKTAYLLNRAKMENVYCAPNKMQFVAALLIGPVAKVRHVKVYQDWLIKKCAGLTTTIVEPTQSVAEVCDVWLDWANAGCVILMVKSALYRMISMNVAVVIAQFTLIIPCVQILR
jgi:hypothetical protein